MKRLVGWFRSLFAEPVKPDVFLLLVDGTRIEYPSWLLLERAVRCNTGRAFGEQRTRDGRIVRSFRPVTGSSS